MIIYNVERIPIIEMSGGERLEAAYKSGGGRSFIPVKDARILNCSNPSPVNMSRKLF